MAWTGGCDWRCSHIRDANTTFIDCDFCNSASGNHIRARARYHLMGLSTFQCVCNQGAFKNNSVDGGVNNGSAIYVSGGSNIAVIDSVLSGNLGGAAMSFPLIFLENFSE